MLVNRLGWRLVLCLGLLGCGDASHGPSGVEGTVLVDSQPAPKGTVICFQHQTAPSENFTVVVEDEGNYKFRRPPGVSIEPGNYVVVVRPLNRTTTTGDHGLPVDVPIPGAPQSYGRYSSADESDLHVELAEGAVQPFDIQISTMATAGSG